MKSYESPFTATTLTDEEQLKVVRAVIGEAPVSSESFAGLRTALARTSLQKRVEMGFDPDEIVPIE